MELSIRRVEACVTALHFRANVTLTSTSLRLSAFPSEFPLAACWRPHTAVILRHVPSLGTTLRALITLRSASFCMSRIEEAGSPTELELSIRRSSALHCPLINPQSEWLCHGSSR